ncbi:MAG TPA: SDR family NAD(P)-dependent oxidoreductase [Nevskiaceae bacterium]|nr:SDR family NAD(P)-dependent oxidoreductase [Nevskiaceae bacterium]
MAAATPGPLQGRTILVTGANDGLGRAVALAAAGAGATVVLSGRNSAGLERVYDQILALGAAQPAALPLDLARASWKEMHELVQLLGREVGSLHALVHCAAHFKAFSRLEDLDPKEWMEGLQVNLTAPYVLTRECLPLLRASGEGVVVFVTDAAGRQPKPFQHIYGLAKGAQEALVKMWTAEWAQEPGLRAHSFYPGPMRTRLRVKGYPGEATQQWPTPEQIAPQILALLGPEGRSRRGEALSAVTVCRTHAEGAGPERCPHQGGASAR